MKGRPAKTKASLPGPTGEEADGDWDLVWLEALQERGQARDLLEPTGGRTHGRRRAHQVVQLHARINTHPLARTPLPGPLVSTGNLMSLSCLRVRLQSLPAALSSPDE